MSVNSEYIRWVAMLNYDPASDIWDHASQNSLEERIDRYNEENAAVERVKESIASAIEQVPLSDLPTDVLDGVINAAEDAPLIGNLVDGAEFVGDKVADLAGMIPGIDDLRDWLRDQFPPHYQRLEAHGTGDVNLDEYVVEVTSPPSGVANDRTELFDFFQKDAFPTVLQTRAARIPNLLSVLRGY